MNKFLARHSILETLKAGYEDENQGDFVAAILNREELPMLETWVNKAIGIADKVRIADRDRSEAEVEFLAMDLLRTEIIEHREEFARYAEAHENDAEAGDYTANPVLAAELPAEGDFKEVVNGERIMDDFPLFSDVSGADFKWSPRDAETEDGEK